MMAGNPLGAAIGVMFLFPDGQAMFDFIDDITARQKRRFAMRRGNANPYSQVANLQMTDAVNGQCLRYAEFLLGFAKNPLALLNGQSSIGFIFQA